MGITRRGLLSALLLVVACLACRAASKHASRVASRVVSISPSTTEALAAIGARSVLVGRSRYCDFPPDVIGVPIVGGYVDPSYEAILALSPDLVTGARGPSGPALSETLAARGIATYFPETESFAGVLAMLRGLGERTGHERDAEGLVLRIEADEATVERAVRALPAVKVLLVFGVSPIVAAGPGGFPDEMVRRAGGVNVVAAGGAYPTLGMEHVLGLDPDVVVDAAWGEEKARIGPELPGWRELRAVREGRVVVLRDEVILRPGPRIAAGLALLAKALHPDATIP
jgi:iron complex transport system substrate-binding protein